MRRFAFVLSLLIGACSSFTGDSADPPPATGDAGPGGPDQPDATRPDDGAVKDAGNASDGATPTTLKLFVTQFKSTGAMASGAFALSTCTMAAQNNGITGTFQPLLGDDAIHMYVPVGARVVDIKGNELFRLEDGKPGVPNLVTPVLDELGGLSSNQVWTGAGNKTCLTWTSAANDEMGGIGKANDLGPTWFDQGPGNCDMQRSVYCIEVH